MSFTEYLTYFLCLVATEYYSEVYNLSFATVIFKAIINTLLLTFIYKKQVSKAFFISITAESIMTSSILLLGPVVFLYPEIQSTYIYNLSVCAFIIVIALGVSRIINCKINTTIQELLTKNVKLIIFITELFVVLSVRILTILIKNYRIITILISNMLVLIVIAIACLLYHIMRLQIKIRREKDREVVKNIINQKYKKIGARICFTGSTLAELKGCIEAADVEGIKNIYIKCIGPINRGLENQENLDALKLIDIPMVRSYLYDISIRCPNFKIHINEYICINDIAIEELDLFLIVAELLHNALNYNTENSSINIYLSKSEGDYYFELENNIGRSIDFGKIYSEKGVDGYMKSGLRLVEDIIELYPNIINNTFVRDGNIFMQCIIIPERYSINECG